MSKLNQEREKKFERLDNVFEIIMGVQKVIERSEELIEKAHEGELVLGGELIEQVLHDLCKYNEVVVKKLTDVSIKEYKELGVIT